MHTCFTWLGTGAFTSRAHVASYLEAVSTIDMPKDELAHADNSFTTFLNNPPYVLGSNAIVEMKTGRGYSDGKRGDLRNQVYIVRPLISVPLSERSSEIDLRILYDSKKVSNTLFTI